MLTHRPQGVMDFLVDPNQAAFVPGRMLTDNVILSHELIKGYGRKGISPRSMFKIDMQKANDSLKCIFLRKCWLVRRYLNSLSFGLWNVFGQSLTQFWLMEAPVFHFMQGERWGKGILFLLTCLCWLWIILQDYWNHWKIGVSSSSIRDVKNNKYSN